MSCINETIQQGLPQITARGCGASGCCSAGAWARSTNSAVAFSSRARIVSGVSTAPLSQASQSRAGGGGGGDDGGRGEIGGCERTRDGRGGRTRGSRCPFRTPVIAPILEGNIPSSESGDTFPSVDLDELVETLGFGVWRLRRRSRKARSCSDNEVECGARGEFREEVRVETDGVRVKRCSSNTARSTSSSSRSIRRAFWRLCRDCSTCSSSRRWSSAAISWSDRGSPEFPIVGFEEDGETASVVAASVAGTPETCRWSPIDALSAIC